MKKILLLFLYSLLVYIYLHNPNLKALGGMGVIKLLYPVALIYFIANIQHCLQTFKLFKSEFIAFSSLVLFCFLRALVGGDMLIAYSQFIMLLEVYFLPLIFFVYLKKHGYNLDDLIRIILIASALASVITLLCLINPSFGSYVRYSLLAIKQGDFLYENDYRGFGISDALTSSYGYIQGFCFALGFHYSKKNRWYLLFLPLVFISTIVNARTGVFVSFIGVFLSLIYRVSIRNVFLYGLTIVAFVLVAPLLLSALNFSDSTSLFISSFFNDITNIYESRDMTNSDTTSYMLSAMVFWPDDLSEWILGRGVSVFGGDKSVNSDIGYINQINYGGLVFVFLLLNLFIKMIKRMIRLKVDKFFVYSFVLVALLLNFKSSFFANVGVFRLFILVYYFMIINVLYSTKRVKNKIPI